MTKKEVFSEPPVYEIGCFPKGETQDSGKECLEDFLCSEKYLNNKKEHPDIMKAYCKKYNKTCEGICIGEEWGVGMVVKGDQVTMNFNRCSKLKNHILLAKKRLF